MKLFIKKKRLIKKTKMENAKKINAKTAMPTQFISVGIGASFTSSASARPAQKNGSRYAINFVIAFLPGLASMTSRFMDGFCPRQFPMSDAGPDTCHHRAASLRAAYADVSPR